MNPRQHARAAATVAGHTLTRHAIARMVEFGLDREVVESLIRDYDCRYNQGDRGPDVYMHQRGEWACVVDERNKTVVTVLRRLVERWEH